MLMDGDHLGRIAYETIRQLGDMDKPVFLDSYIDETTEVGDVGHDTGQYLSFFQILDRFHRGIEREYLDRLAGSRPGLSSSSMISSKVGIPTLSVR